MDCRLLEKRTAAGFTRTQLAERAGITRRYLWYLEKNGNEPSMKVAKKIAELLNCRIDEIF